MNNFRFARVQAFANDAVELPLHDFNDVDQQSEASLASSNEDRSASSCIIGDSNARGDDWYVPGANLLDFDLHVGDYIA